MTCPFLRESQVKFCRTAAVRKLIPLTLAGKTDEKCASADFARAARCTGCAPRRRIRLRAVPVPARIADAVLRRGAGCASSCRTANR